MNGASLRFGIASPVQYSTYRLYVTASGGSQRVVVTELEFYQASRGEGVAASFAAPTASPRAELLEMEDEMDA